MHFVFLPEKSNTKYIKMYFKYKYKLHFENVFQIQNTNMYFKYVFQILVFEILPSTDHRQATISPTFTDFLISQTNGIWFPDFPGEGHPDVNTSQVRYITVDKWQNTYVMTCKFTLHIHYTGPPRVGCTSRCQQSIPTCWVHKVQMTKQ